MSLPTGSALRSVVHLDGKPAPHCRVEIEFMNDLGALKLQDNSFLIVILKTNSKGEFTFVPPRAGGWALPGIPETRNTSRNPAGRKVKVKPSPLHQWPGRISGTLSSMNARFHRRG